MDGEGETQRLKTTTSLLQGPGTGSGKINICSRKLLKEVVGARQGLNGLRKDLRNHGDSPHDPRHDYTAMAEDVGAFIEEHKLEQPTLIGHSM